MSRSTSQVSFLDHEFQQMLYEYMCENEICKTFQIFALRDYLKENDTITKMELMRILNENAPKSQMEKVLFSLLEEWKKKNSEVER